MVYAPSLALSQVTGLNIDMSIVLTFAVCIFYTSIGGIKAVIWTNVFQVQSKIHCYSNYQMQTLSEYRLIDSQIFKRNFISGSLHALILFSRSGGG